MCTLADRVVAAVTAPPVEPSDLEALLRRLLPTAPVPTLPPRLMPTDMELLLECLLSGMSARCQNRHLRLRLQEWNPCWSACSRELRQVRLEGDLSLKEEVVADLDFCDSVVDLNVPEWC